MSLIELPVNHTRRYESLVKADIEPNSNLVFAQGGTELRAVLPLWTSLRSSDAARCIVIEQQDIDTISVRDRGGPSRSVSLLDDSALAALLGSNAIYIDISGLSHHVWAPMFRVARLISSSVKIIYVEPSSYKPHPSPASPTTFDLSASFRGLAPLPGFARLAGPRDETKTLLIAMLGFEGSRPERLALQIDTVTKVIPIVGVPGFQMEYPAHTVACNRRFLDEYKAGSDIRFARASCPFEAFKALKEVQADYPEHYMYIAPVGTKPHALGAVWFSLETVDNTELMYDHPVRKADRSEGIGLTHIYDIQSQYV